MAKIVSGMSIGRRNYPWKQWFNGQQWELKHNEDFRPTPQSMQQSVCARAREMGIKVRTRVAGEYLYVQAIRDTNSPNENTEANQKEHRTKPV